MKRLIPFVVLSMAAITALSQPRLRSQIFASDFQTLPVQMYNSVTVEIDPTVAASSSLIVITVSLIFLAGMILGVTTKRKST